MRNLSINVYGYTSDVNNIFSEYITSWTNIAHDLSFSTKNPGGFSECTFSIRPGDEAYSYYIYQTYHHNFVRINDGGGDVLWEGRIEGITYEPMELNIICEGLWANTFDALYDDGSLYGWPNAEHPIIESDSTLYINSTYKYITQSFKLSEAMAIQDIGIRLTNTGGGSEGEYITVWLTRDNGGSPGDSKHHIANVDIQVETISTGGETIFTGLNTSYALEANTTYWVTIGSDANVTADTIGWEYDSTAGYADGQMKYYTTSWNAFTGDAIFYIYTHPRFYYQYGPNSLSNDGFETAGGGGSDIWASWDEYAGDGAIANETTNIWNGNNAAKLTAGSSTNTYIEQEVSVVPGDEVYVFFMSRGDGTYDGRYSIYDNDNSAYIVSITDTGVTGTSYTVVQDSFAVPSSCYSISIRLLCPDTNGGVAYFDFVALRKSVKASDIVYDAITQSNFVVDTTEYISDIGSCPINPIKFVNNEKPGDVISKLMELGSMGIDPGEDTTALFCGIYENGNLTLRRVTDGEVWSIYNFELSSGISMTTNLGGMKTRIACIYSSQVGVRSVTDWQYIESMQDRFGYNRDGLFSIAGATEEVAYIVRDAAASAYSKPSQSFSVVIGEYATDSKQRKRNSASIRAGDKIILKNILPESGYASAGESVIELYVQETNYNADDGTMEITPSAMDSTLVDVILALAGLTGGSLS